MSAEKPLLIHDVDPLLHTLRRGRTDAASAALRTLVRLPLDREAWIEVSSDATRRFDELGITMIDDLARIPVASMRERVRARARVETARLEVSVALARVGDPQALEILAATPLGKWPPEIWELLPRLKDSHLADRLRPLYRALEGSEQLEPRFWIALAMAAVGDNLPLEQILGEIADHPQRFVPFQGDPMYLESRVRAAGISLPQLGTWLERYASMPATPAEAARLARFLAEDHETPSKRAPRPPAAMASDLGRGRQEVARLLDSRPFDHAGLWAAEPDIEALAGLGRGEKSALFSSLFYQLSKAAMHNPPVAMEGGNHLMDLAVEIDAVLLPSEARLLESFSALDQMGSPAADQLAWLLSRGQITPILWILGPELEGSAERSVPAGRLLERVAKARGTSGPPYFGGGVELGDEPGTTTQLIDDTATPIVALDEEPAPDVTAEMETPTVAPLDADTGSWLALELEEMGGEDDVRPSRRGDMIGDIDSGTVTSVRHFDPLELAPTEDVELDAEELDSRRDQVSPTVDESGDATASPAAASPAPATPAAHPVSAEETLASDDFAWDHPVTSEGALREVLLGTSAPSQARPGDELVARFAVHIAELEREVRADLERAAPGDRISLGVERARWRTGARVSVALEARGLEIDEPLQEFAWNGRRNEALFDVYVPPERRPGQAILKFNVYVQDNPVVKLRHRLDIVTEVTSTEARSTVATAARTAFASYSSLDRERVLDRVTEIEQWTGIDVFQDVLSLRQGEAWRPQLREAILSRDLFLLFWSAHAKDSKEVDWEWHTFLDAKPQDDFVFRQLDMVEDAPPPERLRHLHASDPLMVLRRAYEEKRRRSSPPT